MVLLISESADVMRSFAFLVALLGSVFLFRVLFADMMENAYAELAPHKICQYIFELSESFNHFYHETKILAEEKEERRASYLKLISLVQRLLETCIEMLGFEAPDKM